MHKSVPKEIDNKLDQFYTNTDYAKKFFCTVKSILDLNGADILLEPSAGSGSFLNLMDESKRIGIDIDPKSNEIMKSDFFDWNPPSGKKIITIGNPPFGKNSSLAVKFFNRAAEFSDAIAFILPKTFKKDSIQNRLDLTFHLIYEEIVPEYSFLFNGIPYDVWCCAQIWIKRPHEREKTKIFNFKMVSNWFEIVDKSVADFCIQRVGARAGLIRTQNITEYSDQSHFFIKQKNPVVLDLFQKINFDLVKYNTVGNPSISPNELVREWIKVANSNGLVI